MSCGTCTLCCKVMNVPPLNSPAGQWCVHCTKGKGCAIYESRPPICSGFECLWLQAAKKGHALPDSLRPDKSKCVVAPTTNPKVYAVHVDPGFPLAWREPKVWELLVRMMKDGGCAIAIVNGDDKPVTQLRWGDGKVLAAVVEMTAPDENGMRYPVGAA